MGETTEMIVVGCLGIVALLMALFSFFALLAWINRPDRGHRLDESWKKPDTLE